ncbi:mitochondrial distribution and morphology protein 34 [Blastomyces percursus]|uniref:Mitochondrial distribution and morphology protein 34 n=1 Tax=Blastomyces percursus TaxID=1658174 RepID=A0A1J9QEZ7_9EURO|nr:mitochondrial distribution and morphology protein 34 [Blastomyces percursus]
MAFNFNWSPLMADAGFYTRAQELLTTALNKSPKPPIIVDDIVVTELNLGSNPPELEILEIGDLAEDRFRGIFKMSYAGDAFLTLKTCVQANPLNTYLLTRHPFTSPQPLAAATGLTIPLQITLSDIKLSGFVILVFSKQKGITVVFRNDPLESLKVSSTFDSIPFVRDYLQKEIEGQLRILFMDELPAIIHRLSLRLWGTEYSELETTSAQVTNLSLDGPGLDPLLNPPQDPVDASGNVLSISEIASLSLDSGVEMHSLFSRKNVLRLAALTDSQRTLSLFTPSIREVVFRAWTGSMEQQADGPSGLISPMSPPLSRAHSHIATSSLSLQDAANLASSSHSRPTPPSSGFSGYGLSMGAGRHSKAHARKRKKRVVDLRRRPKNRDDMESVSGESAYTETTTTTSAGSVFSGSTIPEENNDDPVTPPVSPPRTVRRPTLRDRIAARDDTERNARRGILAEFGHDLPAVRTSPPVVANDMARIIASASNLQQQHQQQQPADSKPLPPLQETTPVRTHLPSPSSTPQYPTEKPNTSNYTSSSPSARDPQQQQQHPRPSSSFIMESAQNGGILEQAWMMKMANEIARRIQDEKMGGEDPTNTSNCGGGGGGGGFWERPSMRSHTPPPAYRH